MINIPMKSGQPLDRNSVMSVNQRKVQGSTSFQTIANINNPSFSADSPAPAAHAAPVPQNRTPAAPQAQPVRTSGPVSTPAAPGPQFTPPSLLHPVQKGQKVALNGVSSTSKIRVSLGWNTKDSRCDVDVSAFMLGASGKVIGDDWFVFYGQEESPDHSMQFHGEDTTDREFITIDLSKLNPSVTKIVFVLTINEALENRLNFSMLSDAYIRVLLSPGNTEVVSFKMSDYYSNVTSMMIGEVYAHNGAWKFNAIGNGVARDLAGLCELYGVQTV